VCYKNSGFKNDPSVSSEYVKFLIMNTGMETIDQLEKKQGSLEEKVHTLGKEFKVCEAKSLSASNGASTAKSAVDALTKRVSALEHKK
jgi:polyhydroxyalkanoate synthesis regulator phasin